MSRIRDRLVHLLPTGSTGPAGREGSGHEVADEEAAINVVLTETPGSKRDNTSLCRPSDATLSRQDDLGSIDEDPPLGHLLTSQVYTVELTS